MDMKCIKRLLSILVVLSLCLAGCSAEEKADRNTVYEDMKGSFDDAGLLSANIGIFSRFENADEVTYGEGGSGVIIAKEGDVCYALTAAHVVSHEDAKLLVFTANTEMTSEMIPGVGYNVLSPEVYEKMYPAEAVYVSDRNDLAIISFKCDEQLNAAELAHDDPQVEDRIMCVGNPQNEWFALSYGKVLSGIETFGELQGYASHVMKHSAYIEVGSSGGAAYDEQMKLAGIVPGGVFAPNGKDLRYGVMIPVSEIRAALAEWEAGR